MRPQQVAHPHFLFLFIYTPPPPPPHPPRGQIVQMVNNIYVKKTTLKMSRPKLKS